MLRRFVSELQNLGNSFILRNVNLNTKTNYTVVRRAAERQRLCKIIPLREK